MSHEKSKMVNFDLKGYGDYHLESGWLTNKGLKNFQFSIGETSKIGLGWLPILSKGNSQKNISRSSRYSVKNYIL